MEPWEEEALNEFQTAFTTPAPGGMSLPSMVGAPQPMPGQDVAGPAQLPGAPRPDLGSMVKNEILSGPAAQFGRGVVRGAANVGDSLLNAGQYLAGAERTSPLGDAVKEHIDPHFEGATNNNFLPGQVAAGIANFGGELSAPLGVGGAAVKGATQGLRMIPSAGTRLRGFIDSFSRFGTGAAPIAGGSAGTNAALRVAGGGAATGTAALAADLDNPYGAAVAAGTGGLAGPGLQKGMDVGKIGVDIGMNALSASRVPQLRDEVIRDVVDDRAPQVLANLGEAPQRVTTGLPVQVARDPGISSLHRTLESKQPLKYGSPVANFMEDQKGLLAKAVKEEGVGTGPTNLLSQAKADRAAATQPLYDQLGASTQPVSTRQIAGVYSQVLPGNPKQGAQPVADALGKYLDPLITRMGPGQEGLLQRAPAGVLHNIRHTINDKLRRDYVPGANDVPLTPEVKGVLRDVNKAIGEALNRSRGGNASTLNRSANAIFQQKSVPVNQREAFASLYDDAHKGAKSMKNEDVLIPDTLANKILDMQQKPAVWNQLSRPQQRMLEQLRLEAPGNAQAGSYGAGSAAGSIADTAIPHAVLPTTRPLPGWHGRAVNAASRIVAARQVGRVEEALAEVMREPGGIQTIEQILRTQPQVLSPANGVTPEMLQRLIAAETPSFIR